MLREGLGGSMPGCENRVVMVPDGAHTAHQLLGTVSRFICSKEFCKGSIMCPCETSHGQHGCSLCEPPWGNTISSSVQFGSGPMGVGSQNIFLSAEHLAGRMNVMADWQSRHFTDSSNWRLCPKVFQALMQIRGPCAKDLFADRLNTQLHRFYSWKPDPMALTVDALQQDWSKEKNYAFPPFCLIMGVLAKLREFSGELILVTPLWLTQAWYPTQNYVVPQGVQWNCIFVLLILWPNLFEQTVQEIVHNSNLFISIKICPGMS